MRSAHGIQPPEPAAAPEVVLSGRALTRRYAMGDVEVHALRGVDFELRAGELIALLGASGGGKSTLLNILGGLDVPTSGEVTYRGHDLTAADEDELTWYRRLHVGFVFQFYNLVPSLTARENVELVTEIAADPMEPLDALSLVGRQTAPTTSPPSSRAASSSGSRSRSGRSSSSATSRPARSTSRPGSWSSRSR